MGRKKKTAEEYNEEWGGKVFGDVRIDEYSHNNKYGHAYFWCRCLVCDVRFGPVRLGDIKSGNTTSCGHCLERTEIGNRYGHLVIKEFHHRDENYRLYFLCDCDCGNESVVYLGSLKCGDTTSCGHCSERTEIGNRYGHLVIKEFHHRDEDSYAYFLCECDCGNESVVYLASLKSGGTTSCGHCSEKTEIGNRYGHLVIKEFHHRKNRQAYFLCECDCGNEKIVQLGHLKSGGTTSCGHCLERTEIGNRYGHLVIKEFHHRNEKSQLYFLCECDCGNENVVYFGSLRSGDTTSCGCRTESKGEEKIRLMLEKMGVKFEQEYLGFTDMKDKSVLRCDFWLPGFNRVIEFDGPQHFEPINMFGGEEGFKIVQRRDQIKNQYCWDHGIDIVRIPYWEIDDFTMEDLVNKYTKYLIKEEKEIKNAGI